MPFSAVRACSMIKDHCFQGCMGDCGKAIEHRGHSWQFGCHRVPRIFTIHNNGRGNSMVRAASSERRLLDHHLDRVRVGAMFMDGDGPWCPATKMPQTPALEFSPCHGLNMSFGSNEHHSNEWRSNRHGSGALSPPDQPDD